KPVVNDDRWIWKVDLPAVLVNDGDRNLESVSVQAVTDEGESPPKVVRVFHRKPPPPPRARFLSPVASDTSQQPEHEVVFRVESEQPLEQIEISRGGKVLHTDPLKNVEREGTLHVVQGKALLTLNNGTNILELEAVSTVGRSRPEKVEVTYKPPDVLVSI